MTEKENVKDVTETAEEVDNDTEGKQEEVGVTGGIVLLRTDDGRIVYEKMDEVTWEDITMFSEYLNRLKDAVWQEHIRVEKNED